LVCVIAGHAVLAHGGRTFAADPGKGLLEIDLEAARLVNTHVSYGPRSRAQLPELVRAAAGPKPAILVGDFNAPGDVVTSGLGEGFVVSDLRGQRGTRTSSHD